MLNPKIHLKNNRVMLRLRKTRIFVPQIRVKSILHNTFFNYIRVMKIKSYHLILILLSLVVGCNSIKSSHTITPEISENQKSDTIKIKNDSLDFEIYIYDNGFNNWLATQKPRGYYTQNFLENRNKIFVRVYNNRVIDPSRYNSQLYLFTIDYEPRLDYGYEVNYLLYHYFLFFQKKYNQKLFF